MPPAVPDSSQRGHVDPQPADVVLEIGTGSGFTAAVMARIAERVLTVERYRTLVTAAQGRMDAAIENAAGFAEAVYQRLTEKGSL